MLIISILNLLRVLPKEKTWLGVATITSLGGLKVASARKMWEANYFASAPQNTVLANKQPGFKNNRWNVSFHHPVDGVTGWNRRKAPLPKWIKKVNTSCSLSLPSLNSLFPSDLCVFYVNRSLLTHKSCLRDGEEGWWGFSVRQPPGSFVTADEWATQINK